MMVTKDRETYCHTCGKDFHYLGIARHRTAHRAKKEDRKITFTNGDTFVYKFSRGR